MEQQQQWKNLIQNLERELRPRYSLQYINLTFVYRDKGNTIRALKPSRMTSRRQSNKSTNWPALRKVTRDWQHRHYGIWQLINKHCKTNSRCRYDISPCNPYRNGRRIIYVTFGSCRSHGAPKSSMPIPMIPSTSSMSNSSPNLSSIWPIRWHQLTSRKACVSGKDILQTMKIGRWYK